MKQQIINKVYSLVPELLKLSKGCNTSRGRIVAVFESQGYYKYAVDKISADWPDYTSRENLYSKRQLGEIIGHPITKHFIEKVINEKRKEIVNDFKWFQDNILKLTDLWNFSLNNNLETQMEHNEDLVKFLSVVFNLK